MRIEASIPPRNTVPPPAASSASSFRALLPQRLSAPEARRLLGNAWTEVLGRPPESHTSALLTAHWALETDAGRCMPGHNFAGIKAAASAPGKSFATIEGHGPTRREVSARFRVYPNAEAGAHDYIRLLATHYPDAVVAAQAGDSAAFVRALAREGYFTAAPESYAAGLERRLATLQPGVASPAAPAAALVQRAALDGLLHAWRARVDD